MLRKEINKGLIADNFDEAFGMVKKFYGEAKKKLSRLKVESGQLLYEKRKVASK